MILLFIRNGFALILRITLVSYAVGSRKNPSSCNETSTTIVFVLGVSYTRQPRKLTAFAFCSTNYSSRVGLFYTKIHIYMKIQTTRIPAFVIAQTLNINFAYHYLPFGGPGHILLCLSNEDVQAYLYQKRTHHFFETS